MSDRQTMPFVDTAIERPIGVGKTRCAVRSGKHYFNPALLLL